MSCNGAVGSENLDMFLHIQHRQELAERAAQNVREVEGAFGVLPGKYHRKSSAL